MASQIVPVTSAPNQAFAVSLNVDNAVLVLQLHFRFNEIAGYWIMSVADRTGQPLIDSVPLLTGQYPAANILQQYRYLGIGSAYVINASGVSDPWPGPNNLGKDFTLLWDDTPAL